MTSIFIRAVPSVMEFYGCSAEDAQLFIDLRDEGYSTYQAKLLAGIADPDPQEPNHRNAGASLRRPGQMKKENRNA